MYKVINEYLGKVNLQSNQDIYNKIYGYISNLSMVKSCTVSVSFNRYVVDIRLDKFDVNIATELFSQFNLNMSYPYSSMYVRFNEGKCVRYRYLTSKENKEGFYCDIVIS